jgi:hypothetical protein
MNAAPALPRTLLEENLTTKVVYLYLKLSGEVAKDASRHSPPALSGSDAEAYQNEIA